MGQERLRAVFVLDNNRVANAYAVCGKHMETETDFVPVEVMKGKLHAIRRSWGHTR